MHDAQIAHLRNSSFYCLSFLCNRQLVLNSSSNHIYDFHMYCYDSFGTLMSGCPWKPWIMKTCTGPTTKAHENHNYHFFMPYYFKIDIRYRRILKVMMLGKKTRPMGVRQPPSIILRKTPSHGGRENPWITALPIHSGTIAHERTTVTRTRP